MCCLRHGAGAGEKPAFGLSKEWSIMRFACASVALGVALSLAGAGAVAETFFLKRVVDDTFTGSSTPWGLDVGDLDGDGDIDLVVSAPDASAADDGLFWYENTGTDVFVSHPIVSTKDQPLKLDVADLDGDLDNDIVMVWSDGVLWYRNDGSGSFTEIGLDAGAGATKVPFVTDLDDDGDQDVVVLANYNIWWEKNDGSENFTRITVEDIASTDLALYVADIDGDTDKDIATSVYISGQHVVVWYENDGNESFTRHTIDTHDQHISDMEVADIDDDNDMDIVTVENESSRVIWYKNNGSESFTRNSVTTFSAPFDAYPTSLSVADIDDDGDKDVVVAGGSNGTAGELNYYDNNGNENFARRVIDTSLSSEVPSLCVADINNDGDFDIVLTHNWPQKRVFLYNSVLVPTGIGDAHPDGRAALRQNFPNPFNPVTAIEYSVTVAGRVRLVVFDAKGAQVATLVDATLPPGEYTAEWDGRGASSGVYFYRLEAADEILTRKLVLVR